MVVAAAGRYGLVVVLVGVVLPAAMVFCGEMGLTLQLERAFPTSHGVPLSQLRARDRSRHGRFLQQSSPNGIVDFPVEGTYDPFLVGYAFQYGDGSGTSGYYVSDLMHFDTIVGNSVTSNYSAPVVFGCSTSETGDLMKSDRAVGGIFGFGQQGLSVISQLASQGVTPNAFSHCLKGGNGGGGILVLGQVIEPNIVYTPLVTSQPHYNLNLESIAVNGKSLPIDSSVFSTSNTRGTIVDSGTTLAYLAEEAYDPFINAINQVVLQSVRAFVSRGNQCYLVTSSVSEIFPPVSLNFAGGALMVLNPQDYLLQQNSINGEAVWCVGFQKIQGRGLTILGDLVLKDKIVVYDLAGQRIGWANYDCSMSVNVSATTSTGKNEFVNAGQLDNKSSSHDDLHNLIPITTLVSLLYIFVFGKFSFL